MAGKAKSCHLSVTDMTHFRVRYIPGGMSGYHSAWWIVEAKWLNGMLVELPVKFLRKADYK